MPTNEQEGLPSLRTQSGEIAGIDRSRVDLVAPWAEIVRTLEAYESQLIPIRKMMSELSEPNYLKDVRAALSAHGAGLKEMVTKFHESNSVGLKYQRTMDDLRKTIARSFNAGSVMRFELMSGMLDEATKSVTPISVSLNESFAAVSRAFTPTSEAYASWRSSLGVDSYVKALESWAQPSREHFITADLLSTCIETAELGDFEADKELTYEEIDGHFLSSLSSSLRLLNPDLLKLWEGAWEALQSKNPDRIRHCLTSTRELLGHVMRILAPDEQMQAWSTSPAHLENGKYTRPARFEYIASGIADEGLRAYLKCESDAFVALFKQLNRGTHKIEAPITDTQAKLLLRKVHSTICTMVEMKTKFGVMPIGPRAKDR